jgi:hypothetical protein
VTLFVMEEFDNFTLNCEENLKGEICFGRFWGFWAGVHVGLMRRGDTCVFYVCLWGNYLGLLPCACDWGDLKWVGASGLLR